MYKDNLIYIIGAKIVIFYSSDLDLSLVVSISISLNQFTNRQKIYTAALVILLFWQIDHKYI